MPTVFIIAQDWMLRAGVRAELRELGVEALGMESADDAGRALARGTMPDAVVLDAEAAAAVPQALAALARQVPMLVIASHAVDAPQMASAAAVLYRPVSVGEVVARVRQLLEGQPA